METVDSRLAEAIRLARENVERGGRPFGAVVVRNGEIIASGVNETAATHDPTAHAELVAIRAASQFLETPHLEGCTVYPSGEPCPMCLGAMYMSGIRSACYAYSNADGEPYGLTTAPVYAELARPASSRSVRMTYRPVRPDGERDLYEVWRARSAG